ncbi:hypothetical protein [Azotobacter salinestris]|uniref:hypothetical protein n=1 Tax=Azotobacter salinestris TaxID=69964 RepID=UPI0032DE6855
MEEKNVRDIKIIVCLALIVNFIYAARQAWGTYRWVANFFEIYVAGVLWMIMFAVIPAFSIWIGMRVASRSYNNWLGWLCGIAIWCGLTWLADYLFSSVPGVGWRLEQGI